MHLGNGRTSGFYRLSTSTCRKKRKGVERHTVAELIGLWTLTLTLIQRVEYWRRVICILPISESKLLSLQEDNFGSEAPQDSVYD